MKKYDLKEKSSVFYIGKGIIILSIVLTSSLSFLLGFFVGKSVAPPAAERPSIATSVPAATQQNVMAQTKEPAPPVQPAIQTPEAQTQPEKPDAQKAKEVRETTEIKAAQPPQETKHNKETRQGKEIEKAETAQSSGKSQDVQKASKKAKYTVQIGAFKNPSEADSLKAKFTNKKYKAYILVAKPKKHEKLYKVMVGEFNNRKEAELLSIKIKKAEGLRAFVTLNTEEGIR